MRIIQWFEVVQINEHQRAVASAALAGNHRLAQAVVECQSVGQSRQGIMESQMMDLVLGLFALGHVMRDDDDAFGAALSLIHI